MFLHNIFRHGAKGVVPDRCHRICQHCRLRCRIRGTAGRATTIWSADLRPRQAWKGQPEGTRGPSRRHHRSYLAGDSAGLAAPPGLPITRKVGVGVVVAAIIAGMLVLMGIINDIEDGLHDLNETSQK